MKVVFLVRRFDLRRGFGRFLQIKCYFHNVNDYEHNIYFQEGWSQNIFFLNSSHPLKSKDSLLNYKYQIDSFLGMFPAVQIDDATVQQLADMGFHIEGCKKAVYNTNNSGVEATMNWVMEHMEDAGIITV